MPPWLTRLRAAAVIAGTFAVGAGLVTSLLVIPLGLFSKVPLLGLLQAVARFTVISGGIGIAFAGLLALTARNRRLQALSVPHFALLGAGLGVAYFLLMGFSGAFHVWSLPTAIFNFLLVTGGAAGSAAAMLLVARRHASQLAPPDETHEIAKGGQPE